ncbi:hypothetical protein AHAS_Ahas13G0233300 [Arachis hypogaea]
MGWATHTSLQAYKLAQPKHKSRASTQITWSVTSRAQHKRLRMGNSSTSSTSSTSQNASKTRKPFHFRAKIKVQNIQLIVRNLCQNTIKLSIKNLKRKQSNNTQQKMAARNKTKDLKCATHLLSDKFRNMTGEKKAIVRDLGFGGLMHIPPLRVDHQLLRELANNFKLGENRLKTAYGSFQITPKTIGYALGINATGNMFPEKVEYKKLSDDDKIIFRRFQGKTLKSLTDEMMEIGVGNEEERLMFKRIFILYIQMAETYEISSDELDEWLRENVDKSAAEGAAKGKNKSPQIQRETGGESSAKFQTPGGLYQITDDMKQKCYIWGTRLKEDADGNTNEYEEMCTLIGQGEYILMRMHLVSLQAKSDIESQIVSAICLILNQKNEKRFQEQIYCLPPDIVISSMALSDHPKGEFVSPKTKKEFRVEAYPSFIPFIDRKKLTSHRYRKCHILDPLHKKAPSDERKQINKFTGYVFSRLITYAGGEPLQKGENEKKIKSSYVKISGQKTSYDCAIYVMKWMELIEPENIKKGKYEWDNWPQEEVDHYRVEYASRILFSEMNKERDRAIRESSAIRLSKPFSVLLSPFCQINSADIETA